MLMREQMLSGLKWTAGAKFGGQIITWGITLMVMRLLSPDDYGLLAMATVFVALMIMVSEAGLTPALIQKHEVDETSLRQGFGIVIVINLGLLVALNLFAPVIAKFFGDERLVLILRVLSLQFLFIIVSTVPEVQLQRQLEFRNLSLIHLTAAVSSSILTLALAFAHYGVWSLVFGSMFAGLWRALAVNFVAPFYKLPSFSLHGMRRLISFGGNITLSRFLWFFSNQADVVIVGRLLGQEALGFYSVAMHLASLPVQRVSAIVNQVTFPVLSRFQHDPGKLGYFVIRSVRMLSFIAFPVLWGISSVANEVVLLFLGQKWENAIIPLQLLALMMPFRAIGNFLPAATDALGRPDIAMKNVLLASLIIPASLLFGASQGGLIGVAVAWVFASPILLLITTHRSLGIMGLRLHDFFHAIVPSVSSAAGMYTAVWSIGWLLDGQVGQSIKLLFMISVGALVYAGLTLLINKQGYREVVNLIWRK